MAKRRASPSSAAIVSAVRSSMPRKHRSRWTRGRNGSRSAAPGDPPRPPAAARPLRRPCGDRPDASTRAREAARSGRGARRRAASTRLGRGEAAPMAEEEFREPVARPEQIRPDVLTAAQQVAGGFLLLGRDVNRRQRPGAKQHRELAASRRSVLIRSPARRGISAGAITSQGMPWPIRARCSSKPHGPAS